jgi:hypothetical protein
MPSQVISHVSIADADWASTPAIPLNPGFVAIIGARGSGKTALADVIAAGCDAISPTTWRANENIGPSFPVRVRKLLGNATTTLTWAGGASVTRFLGGRDANDHLAFPLAASFSPPKLAIAPFLNVMIALHASLQMALDMEPFDLCGLCPLS